MTHTRTRRMIRIGPSNRSCALEFAAVALGVLLLILFAPLGSSSFAKAIAWTTGAAVIYACLRITINPSIAAHWGLPFCRSFGPADWSTTEYDDSFGYRAIGGFAAMSLMPVLFLRLLSPLTPTAPDAVQYLIWCLVQDFVFFSLGLGGLLRFTSSNVAIPVVAGLLALSHYPHWDLAGVTLLAGMCWGLIYERSKSLALVTASHWLLGMLLLG